MSSPVPHIPANAALACAELVVEPLARAHVRWDCMKAVHGSFMTNVDAELRAALHHPSLAIKPFTVSTLDPIAGSGLGAPIDRDVGPGMRFRWRLTGLVPDLVEAIAALTVAESVEIDYVHFRVIKEGESSGIPANAAAGALGSGSQGTAIHYADYEGLYTTSRGDERVALQFVSPTAFKAGDVNVPFPLPDSVFGGWLTSWLHFADLDLGVDPVLLRQFCRDRVAVEAHDIRTATACYDGPRPGGGPRHRRPLPFVGFIGACTFRILDVDDDHRRLLNALAVFGTYCGTGSKRSQGAGQTRRA